MAYDFRFRIEAFDPMPLWAHLLPTAMAQFHTIFAMVVFSGGWVHVAYFPGRLHALRMYARIGVFHSVS